MSMEDMFQGALTYLAGEAIEVYESESYHFK